MATINYVTLKFPAILREYTKLIQDTPNFQVLRYTHRPGIIFRIPHEVKDDDVCHFFLEHEINLTNTIRTGTLTLKVQVTVVPCHMGLFSGFTELQGDYTTTWEDEFYGNDRFIPDYDRSTRRIVPLPVGGHTNLYEYLNEILFKQANDLDIINKYAVDLGCQKEKLKASVEFALAPENTSATNPPQSRRAFQQTQLMFDFLSNQNLQLMP